MKVVTVLTLSPSGPWLCPGEAHDQPQVASHNQPCRENLPLSPGGRQPSASVTAQSSTTHSQDTVQSSSVTPSPQSGHGCQGQSPELSTFKHDCTGPFPSMPEAQCSLCSEETGRPRGWVACPKLHMHSCRHPLDKSILSVCPCQTPRQERDRCALALVALPARRRMVVAHAQAGEPQGQDLHPSFTLTGYGLGKSLCFPVPHFPQLQMENNNGIYPLKLF